MGKSKFGQAHSKSQGVIGSVLALFLPEIQQINVLLIKISPSRLLASPVVFSASSLGPSWVMSME